MRITRLVLKTVIFHDENNDYKLSAQQYDYLFAWFPDFLQMAKRK